MSKYIERSCNDDYSPHLCKEVKIVKCFNDFHKTKFCKQEIDHVYWLTDIYKVQVPVAIKYSQECHMCGSKLTNLDEFCCDTHRETFDFSKCLLFFSFNDINKINDYVLLYTKKGISNLKHKTKQDY